MLDLILSSFRNIIYSDTFSASIIGNRSQVQGSTFRVKDKNGIEDPKLSIRMFIFQNNCQFGFKFWIRPDEADTFLVNTHPKRSPGTRMEP
jgi:hypothetical protein